MQVILNFNTRIHNDNLYINPDEWINSDNIESNYQFFIDLNQFRPFLLWLDAQPDRAVNYNDFVTDCLFYNEGDCWGCNYPMYEVIVSYGKEVSLFPCNFVETEKPKIDRRHKIEKIIKENVRLETELKGLRKAVKKIIAVLNLSADPDVVDFLANDTYIQKIIADNPKPIEE